MTNISKAPFERAIEIHRAIWTKRHLDNGQSFISSARDLPLLKQIAHRLNMSDLAFIRHLNANNVTAQEYLTILLGVLEPLSQMYVQIWEYCKSTLSRTTKDGMAVAWDFKIGSKTIPVDFEAFRRYQLLKAGLPKKDLFNKLCNEFAEACKSEPRLSKASFKLPPKPHHASSLGVASQLQEWCVKLEELGLRNQGYYGIADAVSALERIAPNPVFWTTHAFKHLKPLVTECANQLHPEDIIDLPFWKYRWHVYELWCLAVSLKLFHQRGFNLVQSVNGVALLQLNRGVLIAQRTETPQGKIYYQPTYQNYQSETVHPDIVITQGNTTVENIDSDSVLAIVECKQHAMPKKNGLQVIKKRDFDNVAKKYEQSVAKQNGKLVIVNYDTLDFERNYCLLDGFYPSNESGLECELKNILNYFSPTAVQRSTVLVIDASASMCSISNLNKRVRDLHSTLNAQDGVVWVAEDQIKMISVDDLESCSVSGAESLELFQKGLNLAITFYPNAIFHLVTDLNPKDDLMLRLSLCCSNLQLVVHSLVE